MQDNELFLARFILVHKSQVPEGYVDLQPIPSTAITTTEYLLIRAVDLETAKDTANRYYQGERHQEWQGWYLFSMKVTEPYELK